jgi:hypothetical protein
VCVCVCVCVCACVRVCACVCVCVISCDPYFHVGMGMCPPPHVQVQNRKQFGQGLVGIVASQALMRKVK